MKIGLGSKELTKGFYFRVISFILGCFFLEVTVRKAVEKGLNPAVINQIFPKLY
jgi:hypothetical protein